MNLPARHYFTTRILPRLDFVQRPGIDGICWEWTGSRRGGQVRKSGPRYGQVRINGKLHYVHRLVFYWIHEYLPEVVDHTHACGSGTCVNPDFLRDATKQENDLRAAALTNTGDRYAYEEREEMIF